MGHNHTSECNCKELEAEQKIYVIAESTINHKELSEYFKDEFGDWSNEDGVPYWETDALYYRGAEAIIEFAGRQCYDSFGHRQGRRDNRSYLDNIIESKHGSVLENASWSFLITGISRSLLTELSRHRAGVGMSVRSQRYVDESTCKFVRPAQISEDSQAYGLWINSCGYARTMYKSIYKNLEAEIAESLPEETKRNKRILARQAARSVLPNCTETRLVLTVNCRALRHILSYRGGAGAEIEIRTLAVNLARLMKQRHPNLFGDFEIDEEKMTVTTQNEKV